MSVPMNSSHMISGRGFWFQVRAFFRQLFSSGDQRRRVSSEIRRTPIARPDGDEPVARPETPAVPTREVPFRESPIENLEVEKARFDSRV